MQPGNSLPGGQKQIFKGLIGPSIIEGTGRTRDGCAPESCLLAGGFQLGQNALIAVTIGLIIVVYIFASAFLFN